MIFLNTLQKLIIIECKMNFLWNNGKMNFTDGYHEFFIKEFVHDAEVAWSQKWTSLMISWIFHEWMEKWRNIVTEIIVLVENSYVNVKNKISEEENEVLKNVKNLTNLYDR